jgi:hypothetical protein
MKDKQNNAHSMIPIKLGTPETTSIISSDGTGDIDSIVFSSTEPNPKLL